MELSGPPVAFTGVSFRYPGASALAVDGMSFGVAGSEGAALLGPNGAGKSTLLRLAMALARPTAGTITVAGRATAALRPEDLAPDVGYLFQQPESQLFERTAAAELAFGPKQLGWSAERTEAAVTGVLAEVGLESFRAAHPYDLPAPTRRLLALATALIVDPKLLLLDEPTAGLDRHARGIVRDVVLRRRESGAAVLAVTHDGDFALEALSRGILLERGRITADGPIETILGRAATPPLPPAAALARALDLKTPSLRQPAVAKALAERLAGTE